MSNKNSYSAIPTDPERSNISIPSSKSRRRLYITMGAVVVSVAAAVVIGTTVFLGRKIEDVPQRNVIMMISDGFGPASETFARQYRQYTEGLGPKVILPLDEIHVGHSRTQSSSSLVTDSAAGATAFSCAMKSYNGAIGVDPEEVPCGTVLESAKIHKNMLTGLVATSRITHATPGAFSAHVAWRDWENAIAEQQIGHNPLGRTVDLMFGGGKCEFLSSQAVGTCRNDSRDLLQEAKEQFGWEVKLTKEEFDEIEPENTQLPVMALFAPGHMSYEIDRDSSKQPALHEMASKALSILKAKSQKENKGFFLMIEGSRIDMAAHTNDPATHVHEILEYQRTVELVKKFVDENPTTVLISTSDHETGGLTAGRQIGDNYPEYLWYPEVIQKVVNSSEALSEAWSVAVENNSTSTKYLKEVLIESGLGIKDIKKEELQKVYDWNNSNKTVEELAYVFGDMVSRRALIGWSTHGHTAVDVNLYAKGPGTESLRGSHENTDIGDFITDYLGLNLQDITIKLKESQLINAQQQFDKRPTDKNPAVYHG
ncbi:alkaline phosphatase-like protein [Backusella circina FSU 941]|nr:alkaline phosphatase-like protein [Backusella circina FSU 941]